LALLVLLLGQPGLVHGQAIDTKAVDAIVQDALAAFDAPGAAIAIVSADRVVYLKGYGVRELGGREPVTPDTLFAIASCTKAFTTTAMAILVDEGKMSWDDPVRKHLESFRLSDPLADRAVTLRDLVCHRTGLGRHDLLWYRAPWGLEETVRRAGLVPLTHSFRARYEYVNIPYIAAGLAVGRAAQTTWHDFVQRRLFQPLQMKNALFTRSDFEKARDHACPHLLRDGKCQVIPCYPDDEQIRGSGSIKASVRDLSNWLRFQLGDGTFAGQRIVSARQLAETHTPQMVMPLNPELAPHTESTQSSYGLGWIISDYRGHGTVSHGGSADGFRAHAVLVPRARLGIVILTNLGLTPLPDAVKHQLLDLLLGLPARDWNAIYRAQLERAESAAKAGEEKLQAARRTGTRPAHDLQDYAGAYEHPAYGTATIATADGRLVLHWSSFQLPLEHWHFDTFRTGEADRVGKEFVVFHTGPDGRVHKLRFLDQDFQRSR
jgi:CubicO group peptidase (beta-lactamase class C family)